MFNKWLLIVFVSIIQEVAIYNAAFLDALDNNFNLIIIFSIFIVATSFDIWVGYKFGKWFQIKFKTSRIETWLTQKAKDVDKLISANGKNYVLTLVGIINFPYINSFLASWLDISFKRIFIYTLLGDFISFAFLWAVLLGLNTLALDFYISIIISTVVVSLLFFLLKKALKL